MLHLPIEDQSHVGEARRAAGRLAREVGLDEDDAGRAALVATELAANVLKHANGGAILCGTCGTGEGSALEIVALDRGPGIADLRAALRDGVSTAGTAGEGLGAVRRQSTLFDIWSRPGRGTAVASRIGRYARAEGFAWGAVCVPKPGESVSGDGWSVVPGAGTLDLMVVDGLGHGIMAAAAAREAVRLFAKGAAGGPGPALAALHDGLRPTRGAAIAAGRLDPAAGSLTYGGIGNIAGALVVRGQTRRLVSLNGTAGHMARKIACFDYPFAPAGGALVLLHSDGVGTNWSIADYPGLAEAHPILIAAVLFRDFARGRDDAVVLAARVEAP